MAHRPSERWLTLEIRSWKFGFAVLDGARILEWGTCRIPQETSGTAIRRLAFLLRTYQPSVVITRTIRRAKHRSLQKAAHILRSIRTELERRAIDFAILTRSDVRSFFSERGCGNKHEIAEMISDRFREMKARVPPSRKAWDKEWDDTAVFDAVATAIVFESIQAKQ